MASPSAKRRKTSPIASDILEKSRDEGRETPRRASYLSPTKASLARYNPNLLSGRKEQGHDANKVTSKNAKRLILDDAQARHLNERTRPPLSAGDDEDELASPSPGPDASISKKPRKSKSLGSRLSKSPARTTLQPNLTAGGTLSRLPSRPSGISTERPPVADEDDLADPLSGNAPDPALMLMRSERDHLRARLRDLENDAREYERAINAWQQVVDDNETPDIEFLTELIGRYDPDIHDISPTPAVAPLSQLLSSFMPFAEFSARPPSPPPSAPEQIASHRPTESETLPYLKLFTKLTCHHTISAARNASSSLSTGTIFQRHHYSITGPQSLFSASLVMTLDAVAHSITHLELTSLSPWATFEFGPWAREKALEKDIGSITWALNTYWDIAHKRADCWSRLKRRFGKLLTTGPNESTHQSAVVPDRVTKSELAAYIGTDTLVFQNTPVVFQVSWKISFDWTGHAQSQLAAKAAIPPAWLEADERGVFRRVPETFDQIVREKGPLEATTIVARLLFE